MAKHYTYDLHSNKYHNVILTLTFRYNECYSNYEPCLKSY